MVNNRKRRHRKRYKKDGLESKVSKFPIIKLPRNENGKKYIPFCNFSWHLGYILDEIVCQKRNCSHYYKLFLDRPEKFMEHYKRKK